MREVNTCAAQGDCYFRKVKQLPEGAVEVKADAGMLIVGHSETGHHHAVDAMHMKMYEVPGSSLVAYLQMDDGLTENGVDVIHHRSFDTHETIRLLGKPGDVWEVRRQREWAPEGWRRVQD